MKKINIEKIKQKVNEIVNIEYYEKIDSTHNYAKRRVDIINDKTVIIAETQTEGIGTKGRKWYTGKGNISMTIVLKPICNIKQLEGFTVKIAEQIKNIIKELYDYEFEIKEPNDLILNGKKICGILTEINTRGEKVNNILLSVGFNVNEENFDKETNEIGTSLKKEFNKEFEREEIILKIIDVLVEMMSEI